jgi:predicted nucleotidyltransferase
MEVASDISRDEVIAGLRGLTHDLRNLGVLSVRLFGSRARGDNRPDSDVDLLIDYDTSRKFSLVDIATIEMLVEDRLGLKVHVSTISSVPPRSRARIDTEAIAVI